MLLLCLETFKWLPDAFRIKYLSYLLLVDISPNLTNSCLLLILTLEPH